MLSFKEDLAEVKTFAGFLFNKVLLSHPGASGSCHFSRILQVFVINLMFRFLFFVKRTVYINNDR